MDLPQETWQKYGGPDEDTRHFLDLFEEPDRCKVVEIGANEEFASNILSDHGYDVTGIDLREYHSGKQTHPCNYTYIRSDVNDLPESMDGLFDCAFSLSAIEHFGFGTYGEGPVSMYYDVISVHRIWRLLRPGGTFYVTVPYSGNHIDDVPHWRCYNKKSFRDRIVQDFDVMHQEFFCSGDAQKIQKKSGDILTEPEADSYGGVPPHVTILAKLKKKPITRVAPDGR